MAQSQFNCNQAPAADTDATRLSVAKVCEPTSQTLWTKQQPNDISSFSADITKIQRTPISTDRVARKGTVTNIEVSPAFQAEVSLDSFEYWADGFLYSKWQGNGAENVVVTGVLADGFTKAAGAVLPAGTMIFAKGFTTITNNGLKIVGSGSTATKINVAGLTVEASPPYNARIYVVGIVAPVAELSINNNGDLISEDLDFTDLGLVKGQYIYIDGFTQTVVSKLARVGIIAENQIVLENSDFITENGTGKTIKLYISQFVRNVPVGEAGYVKAEYTMENRYNTTPPTYEYARAAAANQLTINAPLNDKMTMDLTFVAQDLQEPVETPLPGAGYVDFVENEAYNTVTNIARVRLTDLDDAGLSTYMKDITVTINNNAAGENVIGIQGAAFTNIGNLDVTAATETVMTDARVLAAVRNNTTVNFELAGRNNEGMIVINIPSMTLDDGSKNFARGEKIKVAVTGNAHEETEIGFVIGFSLFKYLPLV